MNRGLAFLPFLFIVLDSRFGLAVRRYEAGKQRDLRFDSVFLLSSLRAGLVMDLYVDIGPWFGLAVWRYEAGKQRGLGSIPLLLLFFNRL